MRTWANGSPIVASSSDIECWTPQRSPASMRRRGCGGNGGHTSQLSSTIPRSSGILDTSLGPSRRRLGHSSWRTAGDMACRSSGLPRLPGLTKGRSGDGKGARGDPNQDPSRSSRRSWGSLFSWLINQSMSALRQIRTLVGGPEADVRTSPASTSAIDPFRTSALAILERFFVGHVSPLDM